eukprot:1926394-Rhodomonas_salina.6
MQALQNAGRSMSTSQHPTSQTAQVDTAHRMPAAGYLPRNGSSVDSGQLSRARHVWLAQHTLSQSQISHSS